MIFREEHYCRADESKKEPNLQNVVTEILIYHWNMCTFTLLFMLSCTAVVSPGTQPAIAARHTSTVWRSMDTYRNTHTHTRTHPSRTHNTTYRYRYKHTHHTHTAQHTAQHKLSHTSEARRAVKVTHKQVNTHKHTSTHTLTHTHTYRQCHHSCKTTHTRARVFTFMLSSSTCTASALSLSSISAVASLITRVRWAVRYANTLSTLVMKASLRAIANDRTNDHH